MSDFDHIKALLAPQCPQLTARELNDLAYDVFVAIAWADMPSMPTGLRITDIAFRHPPCEQLCQ